MNGRLENKLKLERKINVLLKDMHYYVEEYYYNISTSKEVTTCVEYIQKLKRFCMYINPDMKSIDFEKINEIDIAKFLKSIEMKTENESMSFATLKLYHTVLNGFFGYIYKRNYIDHNPMDNIDRIKKNDDVKHDYLTIKDLQNILRQVEIGAGTLRSVHRQKLWKNRDKAIMLTFITTGMRETALCEMDINRIDFEHKILYVTDKEHKINSYTMTDDLIDSYKKWMVDRNEILKDKESDAFFISNRKERITARAVSNLVRKYTLEATDKEYSPHRLRAAYGNILYEKTNDIHFVSKAMKHANIQTTEIYIQNNEKDINDKVANIMEKIF